MDIRVILYAALLARTAAVVRNGGNVFNGCDFESDGLQGANGRFTAGTGAFDSNFNFFHAVAHRLPGRILRDLLGSVSRALAGTFESNAACARPTDDVALHIGDADQRIVESGQEIGRADDDILCALGLDDLLASQIVGEQFCRRWSSRN